MSVPRSIVIVVCFAAFLISCVQPALALDVYKMQATPKADGVMFGTYPRAGSVMPITVLQDVGMFPMQRVSWDRWSWIETTPGVYDWNQAEFNILVESHKFGAEAVGSIYMANKIPVFYPQDINDPTTRQAAADFIKAYYLQMQQLLGEIWVVIDYEMQWYVFAVEGIDPDEWADWYVFLVNEVKSVLPDAPVICDVIADDHDYYLPGEWLTTAMSVSDALGIDDYGLTPQIIHDDIQWLIDNYADGKPVHILENGFSTWQGLSNKAHGTEEEQEVYFRDVIDDVMTNFAGTVKSYLQFMYPDAGTGDNIEHHWGLVTYNDGREKPALDVFRSAYSDYPPYDISTVAEVTDDLDAGIPEVLNWSHGTQFEFLRVTHTIDITTTVNAILRTEFAGDDGTGEYIVEANGNWRYASSANVNVSDYLIHGINTFNVYFPQEYWPGTVTVTDVELVLDTEIDPIKDTFEVYLDSEDLSMSWSHYLNVLPWLHEGGAPLSHDGKKSMALSYLCSIYPYWGSVTHQFYPYEDWTSFVGFGFYVKGQPTNESEKIRAILRNGSDGIILSWQFFGVTDLTEWTACEVRFADVLDETEMWKLGGVKSLEVKIIGQSRCSGTIYVDDLFCLTRTDTFPPLLLSAEAPTPTGLVVTFTEPVTMESRRDQSNYAIIDDNDAPLSVLDAIDVADDRTVMLITEAQSDRPYRIHVSGIEDFSGNLIEAGLADTLTFRGTDSVTTGVGDGPPREGAMWMSAAPNPFRGRVAIDFGVDPAAFGQGRVPVTIRAFDAAGRLLRTLLDDMTAAGPARLTWDGRDGDGRKIPAGVYFLHMQAGDSNLTKQVILTR